MRGLRRCQSVPLIRWFLGVWDARSSIEGGAVSSGGGLMLLREVDRKMGLSAVVGAALHDPRNPDFIVHELRDLVAQHLYGRPATTKT